MQENSDGDAEADQNGGEIDDEAEADRNVGAIGQAEAAVAGQAAIDDVGLIDAAVLSSSLVYTNETLSFDTYRHEYAAAMSSVRPASLTITYETKTACSFFHGTEMKSFKSGKVYTSPEALLEKEHPYNSVLPLAEKQMTKKGLLSGIESGLMTGFVTIKRGRENVDDKNTPLGNFGFCCQKYAAESKDLSEFTLGQLREVHGEEADLNEILTSKEGLVVNMTEFKNSTSETISTNYLQV
jgi:hypothetical protein